MATIEKISVALTAEMAALVREAVASGEYASTSEVVRDALRDWKLNRVLRDLQIAELRRLWEEGLASGPSRDGEEAFAELKRRYEAMAAEKAG